MNLQFRARVQALRSSYWFIPSLMAIGALLLGTGMIWLDVRLGTSWLKGVSWYQQVQADGAREVLSTIAGSMITVAGVVFSITIVALSYASSQYGPRVLTNFMTDRGNTVTLGTFIATFLYCLMVLRTIRAGDQDGFVPQLAVMAGMVLALCSIGVLIYFIHHVPQTIHINNVVARIGRQLIGDAEERFPALIGNPQPSGMAHDAVDEAGRGRRFEGVRSVVTGYVQSIDQDGLLELAREADVLVRLRYRPGDFIVAGRVLADIAPPEAVTDRLRDELRQCFGTGNKRTPEHDIMFLVSELVEIAARALSPGVNDPMTAITCLDWLGAAGSQFARREMPAAARVDASGTVRVIALPIDFEGFVEQSFGRLRHYAAADMIAGLHMLRVFGELAATCVRAEQVELLAREAGRFADLAGGKLEGADADAVRHRATQLQAMLAGGVDEIDAKQSKWLGGSA